MIKLPKATKRVHPKSANHEQAAQITITLSNATQCRGVARMRPVGHADGLTSRALDRRTLMINS
jgi:hypothetical protein